MNFPKSKAFSFRAIKPISAKPEKLSVVKAAYYQRIVSFPPLENRITIKICRAAVM
jgi:hypothetical protein